MARSKSQLTQAKRARETARLEKRARKLEKKEARKLAALDPSTETELVDPADDAVVQHGAAPATGAQPPSTPDQAADGVDRPDRASFAPPAHLAQ
jgi:hypothetical protein